jgi:hypothetical protein
MSKVLRQRLENCDNHYTVEDLYDHFGMDDGEVKICMNCNNHRIEGGIITCKHILEGFDSYDNGGNKK